jgi:hypothetical protein
MTALSTALDGVLQPFLNEAVCIAFIAIVAQQYLRQLLFVVPIFRHAFLTAEKRIK